MCLPKGVHRCNARCDACRRVRQGVASDQAHSSVVDAQYRAHHFTSFVGLYDETVCVDDYTVSSGARVGRRQLPIAVNDQAAQEPHAAHAPQRLLSGTMCIR